MGWPHAPPPLGVQIGQGRGRRRPLFPPSLPLLPSPFPLPSWTRKGGVLLLLGGGKEGGEGEGKGGASPTPS